MAHPIRIRIVGALNSPRRTCSPNQFAEETGEPLGTVSYHFRELADLGFIEEVKTEQKRGAVEHFYGTTERLGAWQTEWESLAPAVKQTLAAAGLKLAVESIGASVDSGGFESRDDSVLAQDTVRVDERGAAELFSLLTQTMDRAIEITNDAEARLGEAEEEGQLVSWVLAGFPGSIRRA